MPNLYGNMEIGFLSGGEEMKRFRQTNLQDTQESVGRKHFYSYVVYIFSIYNINN